ncbi:leucine-rich repeat domain-containing protein [Aquimarina sp. RZ0]|uniref:leucine-rich repeat domain-containing protein n=1 Tax=Aquimarina sp. RZ0 TaxID=2607730 RepID=UPI0011F3DB89|nr:leucine-rich repeat domain-containing protein [Aquimarina sp. RZ0]KAA1246972.1 leucine-rich repeat domain-containing protein [Aquimarina sp. RZ0]
MINLSNNKNLNLEETFQELMQHKNLEILILDSLNIIKLPDAIKSLSNLKQLSLINNPKLDLVQIFDQLSELHIEFLNLKNNNISLLPENITKLQKIKDLNLSFNVLQHKKNYEYLSKLPLLYSLWIDHNNLKELPETIGALSQIRFLYIDHNSLEKLPEKITEMKKVWVIHAGYNRFRRLPPEFVKMKALLMVHINNNQITTIPNVYETEKYPLAGLLLDNNPINDIEINRVKNIFKGFFLLSFEQKKYD